jgi:hypothetical protein
MSKPNNKPILCLDFDGVVHDYRSGWQGPDVIADLLVPGTAEFLDQAIEHFRVAVFSSRSGQLSSRLAMQSWLRDALVEEMPYRQPRALAIWGVIEWPTEKPPAMVTIDDRSLTFTGNWADFPVQQLQAFQPWTKRPIPGLATALIERDAWMRRAMRAEETVLAYVPGVDRLQQLGWDTACYAGDDVMVHADKMVRRLLRVLRAARQHGVSGTAPDQARAEGLGEWLDAALPFVEGMPMPAGQARAFYDWVDVDCVPDWRPAPAAADGWNQDISAAPRDGTPIWAALHPDLTTRLQLNERFDGYAGKQIPLQHGGITAAGYNLGWSIAAPLGVGGIPDAWIAAWRHQPPLPPGGSR